VLRQISRPRAIILVPNRELALQVLEVLRALTKHAPLRVIGIVGGVEKGPQREKLQAVYDVVVATPGRLLEHRKAGICRSFRAPSRVPFSAAELVFFSEVRHLVVDEADTMFDEGFFEDLEKVLVPLKVPCQMEVPH
jgi:superfamily II DNA/RNA helicase